MMDRPGRFWSGKSANSVTNLSKRLTALWRGVFPSRRQMARIHAARPGSLQTYGYYLLRPVLLLAQYRAHLAGALRGAKGHRSEIWGRVAEVELDEWLDSG